jgi:hypothetical protein
MGACRIHSEITGVFDFAFAHLLLVKLARPLQYRRCNLTVTKTNMTL